MATPPPLPDAAGEDEPPPLPDVDPEVSDDLADGDAASIEAVSQRAMIHQTERTRTYPCTQCGGELEFAIREQKLKCPNCGNLEDIIEDEGRVGRGAGLPRRHRRAPQRGPGPHQRFLGPNAEKEVVCQNCGGHTTFTRQPHRHPLPVLRHADPARRHPGRPGAPRRRRRAAVPASTTTPPRTRSRSGSTAGGSPPTSSRSTPPPGRSPASTPRYFTYDAFTTTRLHGPAGRQLHRHRRLRREPPHRGPHPVAAPRPARCATASTTSRCWPTTASTRRHVQALEPWPTQQALPFSAEYIAGHLCRTYDHDVEQMLRHRQAAHGGRDPRHVRARHRRRRSSASPRCRRPLRRDSRYKHLLLPDLAAHRHLPAEAVPGVHQRRHRRGPGPAALQRVKIAARRVRGADRGRHAVSRLSSTQEGVTDMTVLLLGLLFVVIGTLGYCRAAQRPGLLRRQRDHPRRAHQGAEGVGRCALARSPAAPSPARRHGRRCGPTVRSTIPS